MTRREKIIYDEAKDNGWEILSKGWPDFLLYKEETNEILFIEVKSQQAKDKKLPGGDPLPHQARMHEILRNVGFVVKVVHIE